MRAHEKKKRFKNFCREQVVKNGLINQADGTWSRANSAKAMDRDMQAGYRSGGK
jgi:hypothetical protein